MTEPILRVHVCFLKHYHLRAYLVWYFPSLYNNDMFEVKGVYNAFPNSIVLPQNHAPGLYIRAGSQRSSPASLPGFAGYFHCFTSLNMSRRWTHNHLLFIKLRLLKNLKKTLCTRDCKFQSHLCCNHLLSLLLYNEIM